MTGEQSGQRQPTLMVDFISSLDGYGAAESWPGWWGMQTPEYLSWLTQQPPATLLMGANTYRLMSGFAAHGTSTDPTEALVDDETGSVAYLTAAPKVVFSRTIKAPLEWDNTRLASGDLADEIAAAGHASENGLLRTIGSATLCASLLRAGLVDLLRVVIFPVITGATGTDRIYDRFPDITLELHEARTFEGGIQLLTYRPTVLVEAD